MIEKTKAKVNPRRRLLIRIILVVGIIGALLALLIAQIQPQHDYMVYEWRDDDGYHNLYLYDVTIGKDVRSITDNRNQYIRYAFVTAESAPFVAYYEYEGNPVTSHLVLHNTRTGQTKQVGIVGSQMSLQPDGNFLAYDYFDPDAYIYETRLLDLRTFEEQGLYIRKPDQYPWNGGFQWTDNSLILIFSESMQAHVRIIFRYSLDGSGELESIDYHDERFPMIDSVLYLSYAPDESRVISTNHLFLAPNALYVEWFEDGTYTPHLSDITATQDGFGEYSSIFLQGWHPNSEDVLALVVYQLPAAGDQRENVNYLAMINSTTGDYNYLMENQDYSIQSARWNADASQIMIHRRDRRCGYMTGCSEVLIFDTETGEEIPLPAFGYWVGA